MFSFSCLSCIVHLTASFTCFCVLNPTRVIAICSQEPTENLLKKKKTAMPVLQDNLPIHILYCNAPKLSYKEFSLSQEQDANPFQKKKKKIITGTLLSHNKLIDKAEALMTATPCFCSSFKNPEDTRESSNNVW